MLAYMTCCKVILAVLMAEQTSQSLGPAQAGDTGVVAAPGWEKQKFKALKVAIYCLAGALFANAAATFYAHSSGDLTLSSPAFGQAPPRAMLGAGGIYMMPAQLGPNTFGLYLLDLDSQTITVYRTNPETSRLKLMAARTFRNDRFLMDLNNDAPAPKDVQKLVEQQRQREQIEGKPTTAPEN